MVTLTPYSDAVKEMLAKTRHELEELSRLPGDTGSLGRIQLAVLPDLTQALAYERDLGIKPEVLHTVFLQTMVGALRTYLGSTGKDVNATEPNCELITDIAMVMKAYCMQEVRERVNESSHQVVVVTEKMGNA